MVFNGHMDQQNQEPSLVPGVILADYVVRDAATGKLSIVGCFHQFNFPRFPIKMGRFFVIASITNLRGNIEKLTITCRIEMAGSGHVVGSSMCEMQFNANNPPLNGDMIFDLPFPFGGLVFMGAGQHDIVVLLNNEVIGKRRVIVNQITAPASPPGIH